MSVVEQEWLGVTELRSRREKRFRAFAMLALIVLVSVVAATIGGAGQSLLSTAFTAVMAPVPFAVWWAYARAPRELRLPVRLLAWAATLWLCGSLVWEGFYLADGHLVPQPPGAWDGFFVLAQLLVIAALVIALRLFISMRMAASDAVVVVVAGIVLAAPFVRHGLSHGVTAASLFTLNRPILSIVILMVVLSAALGSAEGLPRSLAMLGLAEVGLTAGTLVYAYAAVQETYRSVRWADLGWEAGALMAMLAASVLVLGIDRPVRFASRGRIPEHPAGSTVVLLVYLLAFALGLGIAWYGVLSDSRSLELVGLSGSVAIGVAMAARARAAIRTAEEAYRQLNRSLADTERARDALALANEDLARANNDLAHANVQIQAMDIAFVDLLNLADQRTNGRLSELVEQTGQELAELLREQLAQGDEA